MEPNALTPQRGAVAIELDRPRTLFFSMQSTWLLIERYGLAFPAELYEATPAGDDSIQLKLKSMEAFCFFLWAGLQDEARQNEETLTLQQVTMSIAPLRVPGLFNSLVLALARTTNTPAPPKDLQGKSEAAAPAEKRTATKTKSAKKAGTLKSRSGLRLAR